MLTYRIILNRTKSITTFVNMMDKVPGTAMLVQPHRKVNAKSLLGVLNTDKDVPIDLVIDGCTEEQLAAILHDIKSWAPDEVTT